MVSRLDLALSDVVGSHGGWAKDGMAGRAGEEVGEEVAGWTPVYSSIKLVMLLWLSRAV